MHMANTRNFVAHVDRRERGRWSSLESENSGSMGRLVRSSMSLSESSCSRLRRAGMVCPPSAGLTCRDCDWATESENTARRFTAAFSAGTGNDSGLIGSASIGTFLFHQQ